MNEISTSTNPGPVQSIGFVGAGLVGASFIYLVNEVFPFARLLCFEPNQEHRQVLATTCPAVQFTSTIPDFEHCEFVFIATPPKITSKIISQVLEVSGFSGTVIDLASTKQGILDDVGSCDDLDLSCYIGGHPLAGGATEGPRNAASGKLKDAIFVLTPHQDTDEWRLQNAVHFLESLSFTLITVPAERHDEIVAMTSHLPHLLAYALGLSLNEITAENDSWPIQSFVSNSTRKILYFASKNTKLWSDIFQQNKALSGAVDRYILALLQLRALSQKPEAHGLHEALVAAVEHATELTKAKDER